MWLPAVAASRLVSIPFFVCGLSPAAMRCHRFAALREFCLIANGDNAAERLVRIAAGMPPWNSETQRLSRSVVSRASRQRIPILPQQLRGRAPNPAEIALPPNPESRASARLRSLVGRPAHHLRAEHRSPCTRSPPATAMLRPWQQGLAMAKQSHFGTPYRSPPNRVHSRIGS